MFLVDDGMDGKTGMRLPNEGSERRDSVAWCADAPTGGGGGGRRISRQTIEREITLTISSFDCGA